MKKGVKVSAGIVLALLLIGRAEPLFRFGWFTDLHVGGATGAEDLQAAVADINNREDIDFVIITGDISELDVSDYLQQAHDRLRQLNYPWYIMPGNHDTKWSQSGATRFERLFGADRFDFEYRGFRFIGIHQGPMLRMGDGFLAPEDVQFVREALMRMPDPDQPVFLVQHYPLDASVSNWFEMIEILRPYNVQAVLHGHGHANRLTTFAGIPGVMSRSTLRARESQGGYTVAEVYPDSVVFFELRIGQEPQRWGVSAIRDRRTEWRAIAVPQPDFSINSRYPAVSESWRVQTGSLIAAAPVVDDQRVYVVNSAGIVEAFSIDAGRSLWRYQTGGSLYATPAISGNRLIVASTDSSIYCLDAQTGMLLWKHRTGAPVLGVPAISGKRIFIGGSDGVFRALNLKSGRPDWYYHAIGGYVETKPLLTKDLVIFGAWDNSLYGLNRKNGHLIWRWQDGTPGILYSPAAVWPVASGEHLFIVAPDRYMTCLHALTGKTVWRSKRHKVRETIGIATDGATIFARTMQDTVIALIPDDREPVYRWIKSAGYGYDIDPSMPIEKEGGLFFGTKDGYVYALDAGNGDLCWAYRIGVGLVNTVAPIDRRRIVATSMDGYVVCLEHHQAGW